MSEMFHRYRWASELCVLLNDWECWVIGQAVVGCDLDASGAAGGLCGNPEQGPAAANAFRSIARMPCDFSEVAPVPVLSVPGCFTSWMVYTTSIT
jgi:hypothetical protein